MYSHHGIEDARMQADKLHAAAFVAWAKSDCSFNRSMITKDTWYSYVM
jgi:hypothetical protein